MIPFNRPPYTGNEDKYVIAAMHNRKLAGDGEFTSRCTAWFEKELGGPKVLLTPSCTHALEMAAILIDVQPGDEIIMPSYTFVSTANAFVLRGAKIVFVDIRPDTMNIDENLIEQAITPKTKAIVPVHYAGVACEMNTIMAIAEKYDLFVIEDAAQGMMSTYNSVPLGRIGHMGTYSFHETKNYTSGGEGGILIINDKKFVSRAEIIREKGTNRSQFFRGMVAKYSWVDLGSSYLLSDLQAAYLWGQLELANEINLSRIKTWNAYYDRLKDLDGFGRIELPSKVSSNIVHNAHLFHVKTSDIEVRAKLIDHLKADSIQAVFHYIPLHSSVVGGKFGRFHGADQFTTSESERLLRIPIWHGMCDENIEKICASIRSF